MRLTISTTAMLLFSCGAGLAQGEPPAYLDDRSDAAALIKSFYNAINRREYARAWDYFGETKPSADFQTFVSGYENTVSVQLVTGEASVEGAAGSSFYSLPVALVAFGNDNSEQVFSGCYTARLASPQNQEPPFRGLTIERAELKPAQQPYEEQLPERCGDAPAGPAKDTLLEQARRMFVTAHYPQCQTIRPDGSTDAPETYTLQFNYKSDTETEGARTARLFRFYCGSGAYNESHIYYLHEEVRGLRELTFAIPELDIRYEDDDLEGKVESMNIIGYTSAPELVNSSYDDATKTITSASKWRGIADASSMGTWLFRNGDFTLIKYEVDASYDNEINPETVLDFDMAP